MHPDVPKFKRLVDRFGVGRVADALLAKWLSDPESRQQWDRLLVDIGVEMHRNDPPEVLRKRTGERHVRDWAA